jgi:hypothetical protein
MASGQRRAICFTVMAAVGGAGASIDEAQEIAVALHEAAAEAKQEAERE